MYRATELILCLDLNGRCRAQKFENVVGIENYHQRPLKNMANRDADHLGELRNDDWVKSHLISLKENPFIFQKESSYIPISLVYLNP